MPVYDRIAKARLTPRECQVRAELCRLLSTAALIKGSLSHRAGVCGKPTCRCARGQKHRSVCLVAYDKGRLRQQHVPRTAVARVRAWLAAYHAVQTLLERLSRYQWQRLKPR
jgi:hypothetical protein